jgi:formylglycine-generating enzyme required for sulfatase activity
VAWNPLPIMALALAATIAGAGPAPSAPPVRPAFRDCPDCVLMVPLPAGRFQMGSPPDEPGRDAAEGPRHAVVIGQAFAISEYDVTRADYASFVAATGYAVEKPRCDWRDPRSQGASIRQGPDEPVVCVSWADARAYAAWLSRRTGKPYRLPSEAEWEYAARAGSTTARPWGPELTRDHANYGAEACCAPAAAGTDKWRFTSPVGAFPANRFGLYDMIGNVWQWVEDCGHDRYDGAPADGSAWVVGDCRTRMVRGGAWFQAPDSERSAARAADDPGFRIADIGFRVARSLP